MSQTPIETGDGTGYNGCRSRRTAEKEKRSLQTIGKDGNEMKVGFIGLGIMGKPMAKNLLTAVYELMVYDHHEENIRQLTDAVAQAADPGLHWPRSVMLSLPCCQTRPM